MTSWITLESENKEELDKIISIINEALRTRFHEWDKLEIHNKRIWQVG